MRRTSRQSGFSLIETLLAVGTLAIGMVFVAGTFLAGMYFATLSTERSIATVVVDEAFAKIRLYDFDLDHADLKTDGYVPYERIVTLPAEECLYPSTSTSIDKQYCWAALCKRAGTDSRLVEFTVFVSRRTGSTTQYWMRESDGTLTADPNLPSRPRPLRVNLVSPAGSDVAADEAVIDPATESTLVNDGALLVDDGTGQIYRVVKRDVDAPGQIKLDRPWTGTDLTTQEGAWIWVVPSPTSGGRDPLVAVYQKVLRF